MFRLALILGTLSAIGPFAIDMYLPALPRIGEELGSTATEIQMTLSAYFLTFGVSQLIYGPLADRAGRKTPLYIGLFIFLLGSLACAAAPSTPWLVAARVVQAFGAAAIMVVPRAIVRDLYTGTEATRLMAMVMLVISVSPMLAPLAGSLMIDAVGWRAIFVILGLVAALSLCTVAFALEETLPREKRAGTSPAALLRGALELFQDLRFVGLTLIGGFGMASFFVFIASASFVYSGEFGLSPTMFSLAFAVNAVGFFSTSQIAAPLGERYGQRRVVLNAALGFALFDVTLLVLAMAGLGSLPLIMTFLFLGNACLGLVIPTTMVMALDEQGHRAGLASSLGGTLQMVAGAAMIAAAGPFFDGTHIPMIAVIAICAISSASFAFLVLGREEMPAM